jgi:hypothetical protein
MYQSYFLTDFIRNNFPEVEMSVRTMNSNSLLFQCKENGIMENVYYADPEFLKIL